MNSGAWSEEQAFRRVARYRHYRVAVPDGLHVAVQDWAPDGEPRCGDVLLLHGFSQAHNAWVHQYMSPMARQFRLVTYDLRGHGDSDQPTEPHFYRNSAAWADEVAAVMDAAQMRRPIVVAWSYAGRVILDYLSKFGDAGLRGLVMVNAASCGETGMMGPATAHLRTMTDGAAEVASQGTRELLQACVARPLTVEEIDYMLSYNQRVPAVIRANLAGRPAHYESALRAVTVPMWVLQGAKDPVTAPAMSAYTHRMVPHAVLSTYESSGHMPFWEEPDRFNRDLSNFARGLGARAKKP